MSDFKGLAPVVIGCVGGSGSRMARDVLNASPQIFMDEHFGGHSRDSLASNEFLSYGRPKSAEFRELLESFMASVLDQIPAERLPGLKYFGWKNPRNIRYANVMLDLYPDMRFVHLLRSPAAMVNTSRQQDAYRKGLEQKQFDPSVTIEEFVLGRWVEMNLPVWQALHDHPRYRTVRYEDLVLRPEETIRSLYAWLGVDPEAWTEALSAINPPDDALTRGDGVDFSSIAEAAASLGYGN